MKKILWLMLAIVMTVCLAGVASAEVKSVPVTLEGDAAEFVTQARAYVQEDSYNYINVGVYVEVSNTGSEYLGIESMGNAIDLLDAEGNVVAGNVYEKWNTLLGGPDSVAPGEATYFEAPVYFLSKEELNLSLDDIGGVRFTIHRSTSNASAPQFAGSATATYDGSKLLKQMCYTVTGIQETDFNALMFTAAVFDENHDLLWVDAQIMSKEKYDQRGGDPLILEGTTSALAEQWLKASGGEVGEIRAFCYAY